MNEIYEKLSKIVGKKIKGKNVDENSSLTHLGLDSLDKAEIMINIEDEFGIEFEEEEMLHVVTVKDLQELIEKKTK